MDRESSLWTVSLKSRAISCSPLPPRRRLPLVPLPEGRREPEPATLLLLVMLERRIASEPPTTEPRSCDETSASSERVRLRRTPWASPSPAAASAPADGWLTPARSASGLVAPARRADSRPGDSAGAATRESMLPVREGVVGRPSWPACPPPATLPPLPTASCRRLAASGPPSSPAVDPAPSLAAAAASSCSSSSASPSSDRSARCFSNLAAVSGRPTRNGPVSSPCRYRSRREDPSMDVAVCAGMPMASSSPTVRSSPMLVDGWPCLPAAPAPSRPCSPWWS
mmetsp:Transcript_4635/g.19757  ORF Transcript_4635/g.19757 Transcript_4635/m.19757 type:complete len:283 (-) Transcript_4635:1470-2318(-)